MFKLDSIKINLINSDAASVDLNSILVQGVNTQWQELEKQPELPILLVAREPVYFLSCLLAGLLAQRPIFIANPAWQKHEWQQVSQILPSVLIWSDQALDLPPFQYRDATRPGWLMIPTGGSSGQIRFAIHTEQTIKAAIDSFQRGYGLSDIHSLNCLPLHHVSGLMPIFRSFFTGGTVQLLQNWRVLCNINLTDSTHRILSLVPTQLTQLLSSTTAINNLKFCQLILLGGSPSWPALLDQALALNLPLSPCYGMTETLGLVARVKPEDFLAGATDTYELLPNVKVEIIAPDPSGIGQIQIQTPAVTRGYYPDLFPTQTLLTTDLGKINPQQQLELKGRQQRLIITGGEKVLAEEVEAAIQSTGLVQDVYVLGVADFCWGQVVKAVYVPVGPGITATMIEQALGQHLSRYKHPKQWQAVERLPRTAQGKVIYGSPPSSA